MKDKKKIAVLIALGVCVIALIALAGCKDEKAEAATDAESAKTEVKEETEQDVLASLSEDEKAEVEKLSAAMEEELAGAGSDKERAEIAAKYSKKIEKAAGGKVQVTGGKLTAASTAQKSDAGKKAETKDKAEKEKSTAKPSTGTASGSSGSSVKPSTGSTSPASGGSGSSSGAAKPAEKQKVWVVDQPAWTETVTKYKSTEYWWVSYDDGYVYESTNEAEIVGIYGGIGYDEVHGYVGSMGNGVKSVPYTETIEHKEVGHWEWQ